MLTKDLPEPCIFVQIIERRVWVADLDLKPFGWLFSIKTGRVAEKPFCLFKEDSVMGIFIYEATSHSITMEEWKNVYDETLLLMEKLPFAECGTISRGGEKGICLVRTEEREYVNGDEKSRRWCSCGDYSTGRCAEEYYLWSNAVKEDKKIPE